MNFQFIPNAVLIVRRKVFIHVSRVLFVTFLTSRDLAF